MANDNFNGVLAGIPKLDFSHTVNVTSGIQAIMEENNRRTQQIAQEAYNNRLRMQVAIEQTAVNTAETTVQLQKVVENQNSYIDVLKDQLSAQKQQLDLDEQQLTILKNLFASVEDGVAIEKEIMKLIQKQIDSSHPLWDYVRDKGGDITVAGVTAGAPVIYSAIKMYLASKGILLP
ncbi:MAG: hypothetical protein PHE09_02475 [Oscillospiraceae bacterium]|nr:hypothetical protein [Oscillospiraceae bacterium]